MDDRDDLLQWRPEFPALAKCVYMVSHSLGAMPQQTSADLAEFARQWAEQGINAWNEWLPEVGRAASRIGRLIGAADDTVMMFTNVSQIQALVASCLEYRERPKVVYTELNFPSVSYVWKAEERRGAEVCIVPSDDGISVPTERLLAAIDERTLIVPISHVIFRSAAIQDVQAIVGRAHEVGALVLLDCYQSTGVVPFSVETLGVDMACGGSVKWLCGGPGAAYLYVRREVMPRFSPRATGWFGHRAPFAFAMPAQDYADSIWRYAAGTPAIAALYQARAGAEIVAGIGVERIRAKSQRQTEQIIGCIDRAGYVLRSPRDPARRGGSVCFDFPGAERVASELCRTGFLCDHRPGSGIRMAPHFYNTDEECLRFMEEVERLRKAL